MNNRTDAAALLLAVLVVIVGPMISEGAWEPLDTIIAAVVAVILWCFTWPAKDARPSGREAVAHALVYGLIAATGLAWLVQALKWPDEFARVGCNWWQPYGDIGCVDLKVQLEIVATQATMDVLVWGGVVAVGVFLLLFFTRVNRREG